MATVFDLLVIESARNGRLIEVVVRNHGSHSVRVGDRLAWDATATAEVLEVSLYPGVLVGELEPNYGGQLLLGADGDGCPEPDQHLRPPSA